MRIGVLTFPGSLDDVDAARALRLAGAEPVALWHADHDLKDVDAVVLPGGFSYGDYLRAGAIAARAPLMQDVVQRANDGMPVDTDELAEKTPDDVSQSRTYCLS